MLAASITLLLAGGGALGWLLGLRGVTAFADDLPTMKPATALMLATTAVALLTCCVSPEPRNRYVALVCAGFVTILSGLFLLSGGESIGTEPLGLAPSAASSLSLLLLGGSLILLQAPKPVSGGIAALALFASLLPLHRLLTMVIGHGTLQTVGPFDSMSLPTAVALFLLASGVFLSPRLPYARQLTSRTLQGRVLRMTLPWAVLIPPMLIVLLAVGVTLGLYNAEFVSVAAAAMLSVMMTSLLWQLTSHLQRIDQRRDQAERVLRASVTYANQVIEAAPDAMIVVDEGGHIVRANARMEQLFGYHRDEMYGQPVEMLMPDRYRSGHPGFLRNYFSSPTPRYMGEGRDLYARRKDGSEVAVEIALAPLDTAEGRHVLANIADVTARLQAKAEIEAALKQKTLLLNEIHHRVKNNLQIVASLLSLQAATVDDAAFTGLIAESEGRVRAMALMHQILYERHDFAQVELDIYLQRLASLLAQIHGTQSRGIRVQVDAQSLKMELTQAIPLGLIVNELLTNAFKHAFGDDGGQIWIELSACESKGARLVLRDNGKGMPMENDSERPSSLGMQIVHLLAEQIGAELIIGEGPGGRFELVFETVGDETDNGLSTDT